MGFSKKVLLIMLTTAFTGPTVLYGADARSKAPWSKHCDPVQPGAVDCEHLNTMQPDRDSNWGDDEFEDDEPVPVKRADHKKPANTKADFFDTQRYRGKTKTKSRYYYPKTYFGFGYGAGVDIDSNQRYGRSLIEIASAPVVVSLQALSDKRTLAGPTVGYLFSWDIKPFGSVEFVLAEVGLATLTHLGKLVGFVEGNIKRAGAQLLVGSRLGTRLTLSQTYQFMTGISFLANGDAKYGSENSEGYVSFYAGLSRRF